MDARILGEAIRYPDVDYVVVMVSGDYFLGRVTVTAVERVVNVVVTGSYKTKNLPTNLVPGIGTYTINWDHVSLLYPAMLTTAMPAVEEETI